MKKILLVTFALMMFATWSFAAFAPTPMTITVQDEIIYPFDGTEVEFTVDVTGKPAKCWLIINTRLAEDQLPEMVQNGYLGWHYVNKIDTTVYVSGSYSFPVGTGNTITWDGKGTENTCGGYGGTYAAFDNVAPGTYDYYVWAYDDQSPRENVCNFLAISFFWQPQYTTVAEWDEAGMPLDAPLLWGNVCWMYNNLHRGSERDADGNFVAWLDEPAEGETSYGPERWTCFKFPIGSDPDDMSKMQTTFMPGFSQEAQLDASPIVFEPTDYNYFYNLHVYTEQKIGAMFKWHWVGDGNAEMVDGWGGWDDLSLTLASRRGMGEYMPAVVTDRENIYITSPGRNPYEIQHDVFYAISFDGELIGEQMMDHVYFPDNPNETSTNGMLNRTYASPDVPYQIVTGGEQTCVTSVIGCDRVIDGDDEGYVKWINQNGDYFQDSAWDPTLSEYHWNCSSGAYRNPNGARRDEMFWDKNGMFTMFPMYQGLNSILIYTHDGSGVSYAKFADDTVASDKNKKGSGLRIDTGSMYDGILMGDVVSDDAGYGSNTQHIHWVAFDSDHGVITDGSGTAVEEEGQAAFSVDAAYPNPANPTTTIGFTIPEAGHVTVDVYNVAGQKVDTLVNSEMTSGKHSVVWDGAGFSAGVYFYTVKSGDFSKTMKVTLLK
jgi:hypothetical protein